MKPFLRSIPFPLLTAVSVGLMGCSSINRFSAKLDAAADRWVTTASPEYEGRLERAAVIGSMTALQFEDGRTFDVTEAPLALVAGDVVRIYNSKNGYVARLWRPLKTPPTTIGDAEPTPVNRKS